MSGFTADFFDALETTFTDGSINMSKLDISHSNANKSMLIRQIREQNLLKIDCLISRMIKGLVFNVIYQEGVKKQRKANKTPLNIHKCFYKIQLMLAMKSRSKVQWAFFRIGKFCQHQQELQKAKPILQIQKTTQINNIQLPPTQQPHIAVHINPESVLKFVSIMEKMLEKKDKKVFLNKLLELTDYWERKSYFIEYLFLLFTVQIRSAFLHFHNYSSKNISKSKPMLKTQKNYVVIEQLNNNMNDIYKQEQQFQKEKQIKPKFKKVLKLQKQESGSQKKRQLQSEKDDDKKKPASGLKFNRGLKIKSQLASNSKIQQKSNQKGKDVNSTEVTIKQSNKIKIMPLKAMLAETKIQDSCLIKFSNFQQFNKSQKTYHISPHEFKQEVGDVQDSKFQMIQDLFSSQISKIKEKLTFSRRVHKIDSKKPLQFSSHSKKSKSRQNSQKSKKSSVKSQQTEELEELNFPSLKSYYFPEKLKYGKALQIQSTKYIGSNKWNGQQKKRVSTQSGNMIRNVKSNQKLKSNEKLNPYFQELKDKIARKTPERVISSQKSGQKNMVSRSNSKTNKEQSKEQKKVDQLKNMIIYKSISPQPRQPKWPNQRYLSPAIPKQWNLYNKKDPYMQIVSSPRQKRAVQAPLQFNKLNSKVNRNNL